MTEKIPEVSKVLWFPRNKRERDQLRKKKTMTGNDMSKEDFHKMISDACEKMNWETDK